MKLVLVSNRLPVSLREDQGRWEFTESPGGLASGLRTYLKAAKGTGPSEYVWAGWPGAFVPPEQQEEIIRRCREEHSALPVFLAREDVESFYEGFCNNTIWPLFHYFPSKVAYEEDYWDSYERVNRIFCDKVLEAAGPDDLVWVHDYHFLLLPGLLRKRRAGLRVGFFLHIPFPSFELFRLLPNRWRAALLEGMLGADLVGFHTHDYTQHFLKSVRRILGHEHQMGRVILPDRLVEAETFPMGVEFASFSEKAAEPDTAREAEELRRPLGDARVILSIDRLDYTKGIANRLLAYEAFLKDNPGWHGRVVLVMVVVPSRTGVEDYQRMKTRIDELVGRINGSFGALDWTPVLYQFRSFPQEELVPLYNTSAVMLVTPLRDGMNLVAKEYVAARADEQGVLVLSEMAGAASELGEALVVNPNDVRGMAEALRTALEMPAEDQQKAMRAMRRRLRRYDVARWAGDFLETLEESPARLKCRILAGPLVGEMVRDFRAARRRLVFCDYDGTLVPLRPTPEQAQPDPHLLETLDRLTRSADVVVISGRPRVTLEGWFGKLDVALIAEHGAWIRDRGGEWTRPGAFGDEWKPRVRDVMEHYVGRLPGSFLEEKEYTLAWHYRRAEPDLAVLRAQELADHLISLTETSDLKVVEGNKVIEVKPTVVGKGNAAGAFLDRGYDFILALGDDTTDEDIFKVLPGSAYSVRVGLGQSHARYHVYGQARARELLDALAAAVPEDEARAPAAEEPAHAAAH